MRRRRVLSGDRAEHDAPDDQALNRTREQRDPAAVSSAPHLGLLLRRPLTGARAVRLIAAFTLLVTLIGGALVWLLDRSEYEHLGTSLWLALQTVTTVGYGDVAPANASGRLITAVLMLAGISILAVVTASITALMIENARRAAEAAKDSEPPDQRILSRLERIDARLDSIEASLRDTERGSD